MGAGNKFCGAHAGISSWQGLQLSEQLSDMEAHLAPEPAPEMRKALRSNPFLEGTGKVSGGGASKEVSGGHNLVVEELAEPLNSQVAAKRGAGEHANAPEDDIYLQVTPRTTNDMQVALQTSAQHNEEDVEQGSLLTAAPRSDQGYGAVVEGAAPADTDSDAAEQAEPSGTVDVRQTRAATGNPFAHFALPNPFGIRALCYMALDRLQSAIAPNNRVGVRIMHVLDAALLKCAFGRPAMCVRRFCRAAVK